jgi:hypothetical protein
MNLSIDMRQTEREPISPTQENGDPIYMVEEKGISTKSETGLDSNSATTSATIIMVLLRSRPPWNYSHDGAYPVK